MEQLFLKLLLKQKLKLILLLGVIFIMFNGSSYAQDADNSGGFDIYYGGKFGTTVSQFTNEQPHTNVTQGITAGGFIGYNINEKMAVQLEISYFEEGGQLLNFETEYDLGFDTWYFAKADNQKITLHNIDIPVLFKYAIPLGAVKLHAVLGADLAINFYANNSHETTVYADDGNITTFTGDEDITSKIERYSIGATGGIGFEIPVLTNNYILIDARYKYGITPVYKGYSYRGIPQITGDLANNSMYIAIGFGF